MMPYIDQTFSNVLIRCTPPDLEVIGIINLEHRKLRIGWPKLNVAFIPMGQVKVLHRKAFTSYPCHHDGAVMWFNGSVNDDFITIKDTCILHRITLYVTIERGFGMSYVIPVEVQRLMSVIIGRRRETGNDACMFQFKFGVKRTTLYLNVGHTQLLFFKHSYRVPHYLAKASSGSSSIGNH